MSRGAMTEKRVRDVSNCWNFKQHVLLGNLNTSELAGTVTGLVRLPAALSL